MIRFVDLTGQSTGHRFAWFDTVTGTFEVHDCSQAWNTWEEFEEDCNADPLSKDIERYRSLFPAGFPVEGNVCEYCGDDLYGGERMPDRAMAGTRYDPATGRIV